MSTPTILIPVEALDDPEALETIAAKLLGKVGKFNPYHDEMGRFTTAENAVSLGGQAGVLGTPQMGRALANLAIAGGYTWDPKTRRFARDGFVAASSDADTERMFVEPNDGWTTKYMARLITEYSNLPEVRTELEHDRGADMVNHLGAWLETDAKTGERRLYLDVSYVSKSEQAAREFALTQNQKAIFDLSTFTEWWSPEHSGTGEWSDTPPKENTVTKGLIPLSEAIVRYGTREPIEGVIAKTQDDKHLVFGWANMTSDGEGRTIVDWEGDMISDQWELEKAAYDYVLHSREGGVMHQATGVGTLVESMMLTDEKVATMGLPADTPRGWWVGFKVNDPQVWEGVKKGRYKMFSIHGAGRRVPTDMPESVNSPTILKFNPNHDPDNGQFTTAEGAGAGSGGSSSKSDGKGSDLPKGVTKGEGTKDSPYMTTDADVAAQLISDGKYVEMPRPKDVVVLVDKLAKISKEAVAKGEKAPNYDLCRVSVPGTNMFCSESLDIKRIDMPQLGGRPREGSAAAKLTANDKGEVDASDAFIKYLKGEGIKVENTTEKAAFLRASQSELVGTKVAGMTQAAKAGKFNPTGKAIFVSRDNYVIDGHHRWATAIGLDAEDNILGDDQTMPIIRIDMPIQQVLELANEWTQEFGILPKAAKRRRQIVMHETRKARRPQMRKRQRPIKPVVVSYKEYTHAE